ncbi:MAG: enoyl-CoA hydratase/isomerase family protein [Acidobacteriota bacterium]
MTDAPVLAVSHDDGIARLELLRPERRNPLGASLRQALHDAFDEVEEAGSRVVLLTAAPGEQPTFAAGADLRDIGALDPLAAGPFAVAGQTLMRRVATLPALVLAAVDGPCMGGALDLVLSTDLVACTERACFAHPGIRLGLVTGWGGTRRLPERLGTGRAAGLLASGRRLGGEEAWACGFASRLPPPPELGEAVEAWARRWLDGVASLRPAELGRIKRFFATAGAGGPISETPVNTLLRRSRRLHR